MKTLRFCSESTPTMNSTDIARVRQPSSSSAPESSASAYTTSNQPRPSDHIRAVNAPLVSISCRASSQSQGLSGP